MNWICVYSSKNLYSVEIVKAVFADNNIDSVVVNKQDSSYLFGEIELHVSEEDSDMAIQIINSEKL